MTADTPAQTTAAPTAKKTAARSGFWQEIGDEIEMLWHDAETFGEHALQDGEKLIDEEAVAVKNAVVGVLGQATPALLLKIRSYLAMAIADLGKGESLETLWTAVLNLAETDGVPFLKTVASNAGQAILGAMLAAAENFI